MSQPIEIANPVVIPYEKLLSGDGLGQEIEEAFGYHGLGLLIVSGIPNFVEKRLRLLPLGQKIAALTEEQKEKLVDESSNYSVGWSHGKEKLKEGEFDTYKGSYYANPQYDKPTDDAKLVETFPQDYAPNIWPKEDIPELEHAFKDLGQLMVSVGALIAKQCDLYVQSKNPNFQKGLLENVIESSRTAKGRLLHYFPIDEEGERSRDSWCGWHNDHSCLTALCSAYYVLESDPEKESTCPDEDAGLYARTRDGKEMKIRIPRDCLAFQIGETAQVLTGGLLRATPHAVQAIKYPESKTVSRDTFAIFMQPNHDVPLSPPEGSNKEHVAVGQWKPGMTYGEFSFASINNYYEN